jgi:K+-transporting ATPase ATPase B chain
MSAATTSPHDKRGVWDPSMVRQAAWEAVLRLDPRRMARNPVMFVVEVGSAFVTAAVAATPCSPGTARPPPASSLAVAVWLWFTVLFANFAEAMAEGRGKAQADSLQAGAP